MKSKIGIVLQYGKYNRKFLKYGYLLNETSKKIHYFDECSLSPDDKANIYPGSFVEYEVNEDFNKKTFGYREDEATKIRLINKTESYKINFEIEKKEEFDFNKNIELYDEYLQKIKVPTKKWKDISYFFDYFDPNWANIEHKLNDVDKFAYSFISSFKNGCHQKTAIDLIISKIKDLIDVGLNKGLELEYIKKKLVFIPVLASNPENSRYRYLDFCNIICDYLGIQNGIYAYQNHPKKKPKHITKTLDRDYIYNLKINSKFLQDKYVILFDDITTNGDTLNIFEEKIKESRPKKIMKLSLGRTLKNRTLSSKEYTNSKLIDNGAFENLNSDFDSSIVHKKVLQKNSFNLEKISLFKNWGFDSTYRNEVNEIWENSLKKAIDGEAILDVSNIALNWFDSKLVSDYQSAIKFSPKLLMTLIDFNKNFEFTQYISITILDVFRDTINLVLEKKHEILIEEIEEIYKKNLNEDTLLIYQCSKKGFLV